MGKDSSLLSKKFYRKLGTRGMKSLTNEKRDKGSLNFISYFLNKKDKILDLACGYGRITFLIAKKGFNIGGVDISPELIKSAREEARRENLDIIFKIGDFKDLPYSDESFDKIICLWSSFNHLLSENEQIKSLNEMYRILKNEGKIIIEMPNGESKWAKEQIKKHGRIVLDIINKIKFFNYIHDKSSLRNLGKKTKFRQTIKLTNIAGRRRLIWILEKQKNINNNKLKK